MERNKLFKEFKQIEYSVSMNWEDFPDEVFELFFLLLFIRILPFVAPEVEEKLLLSLNTKKTEQDENFKYLWEIVSHHEFIKYLKKLLRIIIPMNYSKYTEILEEPKLNSNNDSLEENQNFEKYKQELEEYENKLNIFNKTQDILTNSIKFLGTIEHLYEQDSIKEQLLIYLKDIQKRHSKFSPLWMIDPNVFRLFNFINLNDIKQIYLDKQTNLINILELLFKKKHIKIITPEINLTLYILFSIYNIDYKISSIPVNQRNIIFLGDYSYLNNAEQVINSKLGKVTDFLTRTNKIYFILSKKYVQYEKIKRALTYLIENDLLRTILYSPNSEIIIIELFHPSNPIEQKKFRIFNYESIIKKEFIYSVNSLFFLEINFTQISSETFLTNGVSLQPIFSPPLIRKKIRDIFKIVYGNTPISLRISRKKRKKEIITSETGEYIILEENLIGDKTNLKKEINILSLKKVTPPKSPTFVDQKAIIIFIKNGELFVNKFIPTSIVNKVLLAKGIIALMLQDDDFDFDSVFEYLSSKSFYRTIFNRVPYDVQSSLIIDLILEEFILAKPKEEEIETYSEQKKIASEKEILSEFRHNTSGKINRTVQNLQSIKDFLEKNNLLDVNLYEDNEQQEVGVESLSEDIKSVIEKSIDNQNYVRKYLSQIKELFGEIDYEHFEIIDLFMELLEIKKNFESTLQMNNIELIINGKEGIYKISAHKDYFHGIIEELINNAIKYAFEDTVRDKKNISFSFELIKNDVVMKYSNNGKKFSISKEDYIFMGKTTDKKNGTGYGGAMIDKYVTAFNGRFEIIDSPSMQMNFYFPIKKEE
jgi:signal transduction histidine kinase